MEEWEFQHSNTPSLHHSSRFRLRIARKFGIARNGSASLNGVVLAGITPDFENFDPDEVMLLLGSAAASGMGIFYWALRLRPVSKFGCAPFQRMPVAAGVLTGFLALALVVWKWADQQIRDNSGYVLLVFAMGGACVAIGIALLPWMTGISLRDDVYERRNSAASIAAGGVMAGLMLAFSAANAGDGPSFWNNVFSGLLSGGTLFVLLLTVASAGGAAASITEERDAATAVRFALLAVAGGLILGRAIAGDWESTTATTRDFIRDGWPALLLFLIAAALERVLRPTPQNPRPSTAGSGWLPGTGYLIFAMAWCAYLGWWGGAAK